MPPAQKTKSEQKHCCDQLNKDEREGKKSQSHSLFERQALRAGSSGLLPSSAEGVESRGLSARLSCAPGPPLPLPLFSTVKIPCLLDVFLNAVI